MRKLDQRGIAAIPLIAIIAVSTGAAIATPVIVDVADVDPDSPFYGLERLGESIRMVGNEDQMRERWTEYTRLVDRGKGLVYRHILTEFEQKMQEVVPGDVAANPELVQWMQEQTQTMSRVRLRLALELAQNLKGDLPAVGNEIESEIGDLEGLEQEISTASQSMLENINAHIHLIVNKLENIANRYQNQVRTQVEAYLGIDNAITDANVTVNVEATINVFTPSAFGFRFNLKLGLFENELAEVMLKLESAPDNTYGKQAAERLINRAVALKDSAVQAYNQGKTRLALGLIYSANARIRYANGIFANANQWELTFTYQWTNWQQVWENMKQQWTAGGTWQNVLENYQQYAHQITQQWQAMSTRNSPVLLNA